MACHIALSFVIAVALPSSAAISPHNNTSATPELSSEYVKVTLATVVGYATSLNVTAPLLGSTRSTPKAFEWIIAKLPTLSVYLMCK